MVRLNGGRARSGRCNRLRSNKLSPPEKYLLSRVDGKRDSRGITAVALPRELDALKYFQRFVEGSLVRLRG